MDTRLSKLSSGRRTGWIALTTMQYNLHLCDTVLVSRTPSRPARRQAQDVTDTLTLADSCMLVRLEKRDVQVVCRGASWDMNTSEHM